MGRTATTDRLSHALTQAARQKTMLSVIFMDLKDFKSVNDNFGHGVGDEVIKLAAEKLQDCIRSANTVARQGGDEFILVQEKTCIKISTQKNRAVYRTFK